jgi:branched-chain amino acid transport system substrate-binding protein
MSVLEMCGDDLTRENVMKRAASLKDFTPDVLLPGIKINTAADDFAPISQLQIQRFNGQKWELFGEVINGDVPADQGPQALKAENPQGYFGIR